MEVTDSGIVTFVKEVQPQNTASPTELADSEIVNEVSFSHPPYAKLKMANTMFEME